MIAKNRSPWFLVALAGAALAAAQDTPSGGPWPLRMDSGSDRITVYAPEWDDLADGALRGRAAASVASPASAPPVFGAVELSCRVSVDRTARTMKVLEVEVPRARFPGLAASPERAVADALRAELPLVLPLADVGARPESQFSNEPPRIVFRDHPAVKVQYDGPPRFAEIEDVPLLRAVNTPFLVVLDSLTKTYYLHGVGRWFEAADALGPFQDAPTVPAEIQTYAQNSGVLLNELQDPRADTVEIVTATEPTELIWTDGPSEYAPVADTDLLYVVNTESDVFMHIPSQDLYVLLSGRWYRAPGREGPWTFVAPDALPRDFAMIPPGSAKGRVLAHVAGTPTARDAVLEGAVPQTAVVDRKAAARPQVAYEGEPEFVDAGVPWVRYAANTVFSVLEVRGMYYCCWEGVWYVASWPLGPWEVCVAVPAEIYALPPRCPLYPVRYVYVYDYDPCWVTCGYLPGYFSCYPYWGTVVYGTGYRYHGWFGRHRYYPRPWTFGYAARYSWSRGCWGFSVGWGGPSLWLNIRIGTGGWASGGSYGIHTGGGWWGYGGYRHVRHLDAPPVRTSYDSLYARTTVRPSEGIRPAPVPSAPPLRVWDRDGGRGTVVMPDRPRGRERELPPPAAERPSGGWGRPAEPPQVERPPAVERPSGWGRPAERPRVERPVDVEPPRVERPPTVERPSGWGRPAERPRVERPPDVEPPRVERPPAAQPPRVERPPQQERVIPRPPQRESAPPPRVERPPQQERVIPRAPQRESPPPPRAERPPQQERVIPRAPQRESAPPPRVERPPARDSSPSRGWGSSRDSSERDRSKR